MLSSTKKKYMFIIYELYNRMGCVRYIDIARALDVKKASVSLMLPNLISQELIERSEDGSVMLTSRGAKIAGDLYVKYLAMYQFFSKKIGSSPENARSDAICCICSLSDENTKGITDYILDQ